MPFCARKHQAFLVLVFPTACLLAPRVPTRQHQLQSLNPWYRKFLVLAIHSDHLSTSQSSILVFSFLQDWVSFRIAKSRLRWFYSIWSRQVLQPFFSSHPRHAQPILAWGPSLSPTSFLFRLWSNWNSFGAVWLARRFLWWKLRDLVSFLRLQTSSQSGKNRTNLAAQVFGLQDCYIVQRWPLFHTQLHRSWDCVLWRYVCISFDCWVSFSFERD